MHDSLVLEPGDTQYLGVLQQDGKYVEVRVCNVAGQLVVNLNDPDITVTGR